MVQHVLKYNKLTQEITAIEDPAGTPVAEGAFEGDIWVLHHTTPITGLYSVFMENHYIKNTQLLSRGPKTHFLQTWNAGESKWEVILDSYLTFIRLNRDKLLNSSDWTQLADTSLTDEKVIEWKAYRQLLRDITGPIIASPSGYLAFETTVAWPTPPS